MTKTIINLFLIISLIFLLKGSIASQEIDVRKIVDMQLRYEPHIGDPSPADEIRSWQKFGVAKSSVEKILIENISSSSLMNSQNYITIKIFNRSISFLGDLKTSHAAGILEDIVSSYSVNQDWRADIRRDIAIIARVNIGGKGLTDFSQRITSDKSTSPSSARSAYSRGLLWTVLYNKPDDSDLMMYDELLYEVNEGYRVSDLRENLLKRMEKLNLPGYAEYAAKGLEYVRSIPPDKRAKLQR
ncbi:MAG: hypothetical protein NTX50_30215 [Candidatus Sumerlaeota bacterium]|nr:hypothetical protein [Candidatus Sumerlaeota bacterium]